MRARVKSLLELVNPGGLFGGGWRFLQVMRETDFGEIRRQATRPLRLLVTGDEPAAARGFAESLFGGMALPGWSVAVEPLEASTYHEEPDITLLLTKTGQDPRPLLERFRRGTGRSEVPVVGVVFWDDPVDKPVARIDDSWFRLVGVPSGQPKHWPEPIAAAIMDLEPDLALALGRRLTAFRPVIAERLIRDTSFTNGQFALLSSLPATMPVIGGIVSGGADLLVLTKNQAIMVYKLAALFGRNLDDNRALALEISPVIGGAFVWRTLARTLLGFVPGLVGGLPKAAVAFVGTYATGQAAGFYYSTGRRPPPEMVERFQQEGARLSKQVMNRLRGSHQTN